MKLGTTLTLKRQASCRHGSRLTIRTLGIERRICEECDHVSFAFSDEGATEVDREAFARPVDHLATT